MYLQTHRHTFHFLCTFITCGAQKASPPVPSPPFFLRILFNFIFFLPFLRFLFFFLPDCLKRPLEFQSSALIQAESLQFYNSPTRPPDMNEMISHFHILQRTSSGDGSIDLSDRWNFTFTA